MYVRKKRVAERELDGELLVVPVVGASRESIPVVLLNSTARYIWNCIDGRRNAEAIAEMVCETYEVDKKRALADTRRFLQALEKAGLVEFGS